MEAYIIREIANRELPQCAAVIRESFLTVAKDFNLTPENCPTNPAFIADERVVVEKEQGNLMFGLFEQDCLVGFLAIQKKGEGVFELKRVAVLPAHRHCGYGKALLDFAKRKVASLQGKKITIGIIEDNIVLKYWYEQNGFASTGTAVFAQLPFTVGFMEMVL